jgi:hypothetical protein
MHSLQHYMKEDQSSLKEVEDSIKTSNAQPTQKKILEEKTGDVRPPEKK